MSVSCCSAGAAAAQSLPVLDTLTPDTWADTVVDPANALARMTVNASTIDETNGSQASQSWLIRGDRALCEVQVVEITNTMGAGSSTGVWIDLATEANPFWDVPQDIVGSDFCDCTIEFREKANTSNTTGAVAFTLAATVTS